MEPANAAESANIVESNQATISESPVLVPSQVVAATALELPHIEPTKLWLGQLAILMVNGYGMPEPCSLCAKRTCYHLWEVGPDSARILRLEAIAPCELDRERIPEENRAADLPGSRADVISPELLELIGHLEATAAASEEEAGDL